MDKRSPINRPSNIGFKRSKWYTWFWRLYPVVVWETVEWNDFKKSTLGKKLNEIIVNHCNVLFMIYKVLYKSRYHGYMFNFYQNGK